MRRHRSPASVRLRRGSLCSRLPHTRLLAPRGATSPQLVLVRGDFSGHLRKADAAHLLTLMRYYYFSEPAAVETFNLDPRAFDWTRHLAGCPNPPHLASSSG